MKLVVLPLLLPLASICSCSADTPRYKMTVLPLNFMGGYDQLDHFNFGGGIKGNSVIGTQTVHQGRLNSGRAAVWQRGRPMRSLDTTPITPRDPNSSEYAALIPTALNRRGECVGYSYYTFSGAGGSGHSETACFWQAGQSAKLPEDYRIPGRADLNGFPADTDSAALAINDSSEIVGSVTYDPHQLTVDDPPAGIAGTHAFLCRRGKIKLLWPGIALGINNRGWIVGMSDTNDDLSSSDVRGILWRNGHITLFKMRPAAISDSGEIAGNIPFMEDDSKACVWRQGRVTRLSKQISHAYALNNKQQVVGEIDGEAKPFSTHAVLWQSGRTYDLNHCVRLPKGWALNKAIGINDSGWIIGEGSVRKTPKDTQAVKTFTCLLTPE